MLEVNVASVNVNVYVLLFFFFFWGGGNVAAVHVHVYALRGQCCLRTCRWCMLIGGQCVCVCVRERLSMLPLFISMCNGRGSMLALFISM